MNPQEITQAQQMYGRGEAAMNRGTGIIGRIKGFFNQNPTVLYTIAAILVSLIVRCVGFLETDADITFAILLVLVLAMGVGHLFILYKHLTWADKNAFTQEFLFTFGLSLSFALFWYVCSKRLFPQEEVYYAYANLIFTLPFLALKCFDYIALIPQEKFKKWYYPLQGLPDFETPHHETILRFYIDLHKTEEAPFATTYEVQSMVGMRLGDFFYYWLEENNSSHKEKQITVVDAEGKPYGWLFILLSPKGKSVLDPEKDFVENKVTHYAKVIAERYPYDPSDFPV